MFSLSASVFSCTQSDPRFSLFVKCSYLLLQFKHQSSCKVCSYKSTSLVRVTSVCASADTFDLYCKSTYLWHHSKKKKTLWEELYFLVSSRLYYGLFFYFFGKKYSCDNSYFRPISVIY